MPLMLEYGLCDEISVVVVWFVICLSNFGFSYPKDVIEGVNQFRSYFFGEDEGRRGMMACSMRKFAAHSC